MHQLSVPYMLIESFSDLQTLRVNRDVTSIIYERLFLHCLLWYMVYPGIDISMVRPSSNKFKNYLK